MKSNAIEKSQPRMTDRDWLPSIKKLIYKRNNYTNNQELLKQWHNVRAETRISTFGCDINLQYFIPNQLLIKKWIVSFIANTKIFISSQATSLRNICFFSQ